MSQYPKRPIGELTFNLDRLRIPVKGSDRRDGPYPYYGASGVVDSVDDFLFEGMHLLVAEDGENLRSRKTPVAFLADGKFWVNNHAHVLQANDANDLRFLAYALEATDISGFITGSAQPKLNQESLAAIPVPAPPMATQSSIAATLGALDDKIVSNRRIASLILNLLEAKLTAALEGESALFTIDEVAVFHNRRRVPLSSQQRQQRAGDYPYYGATGIFGFVDDFIFDEILTLVGEDGSVVKDDGTPVTQYIWGKSWINNHAHPLIGNGISTELLFLALRGANVRPIITGAVQAKISMTNLKALELRLPSGSKRSILECAIHPLFRIYRQKLDEVQQLTALRDALLPGLLSGRIRVPEAKQVLQDAIEESEGA